jgi:predicted DNA-binding protein
MRNRNVQVAHKTALSLYIDVSLKERLHDLSLASDKSMAEIIAEILNKHLPDYEKNYSVQPRLNLQAGR